MGCGPAEERVLLTGLHAVADIYCECCKTTLGWKYVRNTCPFYIHAVNANLFLVSFFSFFWINFFLLNSDENFHA